MVCYGCGIDLHGFQAYQSLYCSQCLNRRALEKQTLLQASIAERQLELQREQLEQFQEQRELTESRQYISAPVARPKPRKKFCRPYTVIREEMAEDGGLPDPDELCEAYRTLYDQAVHLVTEKQRVSIAMLQRYLGLSYAIASEVVTDMNEKGVIAMEDNGIEYTVN